MEDDGLSAFSKKELGRVAKALSLMGDAAVDEARKESNALAQFALKEIKQAAYGRQVSQTAIRRIVDGAKISFTSKTGRIDIGFARQKFSGGATTQILWPGLEFGTKNPKLGQFPRWSGRYGRGSRGWFIYPTLRAIQPELVKQWIEAIDRIKANWSK